MEPTDTYTFEIRVCRNPRKQGDSPKPVTTLAYHNLNYGALVGIECAVTCTLMPALSELGRQQANAMGFEIPKPGE